MILRPRVDSDGDGAPDDWNIGFGAGDSTTGLVLDTDDDNDGVNDDADAFPNDPTDATDTDGDGIGDNKDAFPNDATQQFLPMDQASRAALKIPIYSNAFKAKR